MLSLDTAVNISMLLTVTGLVAGSVRMLLGPSRADRVVSLDLITVLMIAIASLLALQLENPAYLDLGLALALIGFLATVAFARYVERDSPVELTAGMADNDKSSEQPDEATIVGKSQPNGIPVTRSDSARDPGSQS